MRRELFWNKLFCFSIAIWSEKAGREQCSAMYVKILIACAHRKQQETLQHLENGKKPLKKQYSQKYVAFGRKPD